MKPLAASVVRWLLFSVLAFCGSYSGRASEFQVEGTATMDIYSLDYLDTSVSNHFIVTVRGQEWGIMTWYPGGPNRLECYKDKDFLRTVYATAGNSTGSENSAGQPAYVERLEHPSNQDSFLQVLWLAYCSSAYLKSNTNGQIEPVWQLDNPVLQKQGFTLSGRWTLGNQPPQLPLELSYVSDGIYHGYDAAKKAPREVHLPPPYNTGYTCAVYQAVSLTNLNGQDIPTRFYFERSQTPLRGRMPRFPRIAIHGSVERVTAVTSVASFVPPYRGLIFIHDARGAQAGPANSSNTNLLIYRAENGHWPMTASAERLR